MEESTISLINFVTSRLCKQRKRPHHFLVRARKVMAVLLVATLSGVAALPAAQAQNSPEIRIGGKNFTEQLLLANLTARFLAQHGFRPVLKTGLGTVVMRQALEHDQLDLVWDYTGTALIVYYHVAEKLGGPESYERAARLDQKKGLIWLQPSALNSGYAIVVPQSVAIRDNIHTISDLVDQFRLQKNGQPVKANQTIQLGTDYEFPLRPDGLPGLEKWYDFSLSRRHVKSMDPGLVYLALKNKQLYSGVIYSSDGRITGFNLSVLDDDKHYFPAYIAVPVIRQSVLERYPQLRPLLAALAQRIDTTRMQELNRQVDIEQRPVAEVVEDFLRSSGLADLKVNLDDMTAPSIPDHSVVGHQVSEEPAS